MWTFPVSRLLAKSVSERKPSLVRKEDIVMGALIDRLNHLSVTVWISLFITSVAVTSTTSPFSNLWTNGIAPRDGLSKALLILRHIDF